MIYAWISLWVFASLVFTGVAPFASCTSVLFTWHFIKALTSGQDKLPSGTCLTFHLSHWCHPRRVPFPLLPGSVAESGALFVPDPLTLAPSPRWPHIAPSQGQPLQGLFLWQTLILTSPVSGSTVQVKEGTILNPRRKVIVCSIQVSNPKQNNCLISCTQTRA